MRIAMVLAGCGMVALAACQPAVPESGPRGSAPQIGQGVGFNNSLADVRARQAAEAEAREAALAQQYVTIQPPAAGIEGAAGPTTGLSAQAAPVRQPATRAPVVAQAPAVAQQPLDATRQDRDLARIEAEADARARAQNSGDAVVNASPGNAAPVILNNPGISSEQDFEAVSAQRTIEDDAARLAANRAQQQIVAPTALPTRQGSAQPNIVAYALQTRHGVGTRVYRRVSLNANAKFRRNCAGFATADEAQIAFLAEGGPERDRKGLDPDGDGYACGWDPAPYRRLGG